MSKGDARIAVFTVLIIFLIIVWPCAQKPDQKTNNLRSYVDNKTLRMSLTCKKLEEQNGKIFCEIDKHVNNIFTEFGNINSQNRAILDQIKKMEQKNKDLQARLDKIEETKEKSIVIKRTKNHEPCRRN